MSDETILQQILSRWEELRERGEAVTMAELCKDHLHLLPQLEQRLTALQRIEALVVSTVSGEPASAPGPAGLPEIPGYQVEQVLGQGTTGVVFRARQPGT